jgi:hypothetical protein
MENSLKETNVIRNGVRFKVGDIRYTLHTNVWINSEGKTEKVYHFQIFRKFTQEQEYIMIQHGFTLMKKFKGNFYGAYKVYLKAQTVSLFMALWTAMGSRAEDIPLIDLESIDIDIVIKKMKDVQKESLVLSIPIQTNLRIKH